MGINIDESNIFKSTIGQKHKLTLEDIAKCTGGGKGIGATVSRNLSRIMALRKGEGWVTGSKVEEIVGKTTDRATKINSIQATFDSKIEEIKKDFTADSNLNLLLPQANKIAILSQTLHLGSKSTSEAKKIDAALKSLSELKAIDPIILLGANVGWGYRNSLIDDFVFSIKKLHEPPQSESEVRELYHHFLREKTSFIKSSPINDEKLKLLESYSNAKELKPIIDLQNNELFKIDGRNVINNLFKGFGKMSMSSGYFLASLNSSSLDTEERLTKQITKDYVRQFFDHIYNLNNGFKSLIMSRIY